MKKLVMFLTAFAALTFTAGAQNQGFFTDTLTSSSDSIYFYPGVAAVQGGAAAETYGLGTKKFNKIGTLNVLMVSDSLSGSTAGTAVLQYAYEDEASAANRVWYTKTSLTINGATQQQSLTADTDFNALSWRVRITGSGTQSTRQRVFWAYRPD